MTLHTISPWEALGPHTYRCTLEPHGVTVGLVVGTERAVLIDAGSSPNQGRDLLASARQQARVPVTDVVITHPHHDHWFGAAGMDNVTVLAHEDLNGILDPEVTDAATAIGLSQLPKAQTTFALAKSLDLGGCRIEALHFGAAHTGSDVVVVVPEDNVIFVGDLVESAGDPQFGPSTDAAAWPKALDAVLGASTEATVFVPGHGAPVDRGFCFQQRAEIAMVAGTVEHLVSQGVRLEDAPRAAEWPFNDATMAQALPVIYTQLATKGIIPRRHLPLVW